MFLRKAPLQKVWQCLKAASHATVPWANKAIVPLLSENGTSTGATETVIQGSAEGISFDAEISVSYLSGDVEPQVATACASPYPSGDISRVRALFYGFHSVAYMVVLKVWLTVQNPATWSVNAADNIQFIWSAINNTQAYCGTSKNDIGIATTLSDWTVITGNSKVFNSFALWYKSYDGQATFKDFQPFGGWQVYSVIAKTFAPAPPLPICGLNPEAIFYTCDSSLSSTDCGIHA